MVASGELAKGRQGRPPASVIPACPCIWSSWPAARRITWPRRARIAAGEGADIIDINMGCPAKKVTGGYSGSALMRDLDHALSLIDAVVDAVDVPVTVKMRLGWDETTLNAPLLARRAEQAGVKMVTVHGRTRCQFYQGKADWRAIASGQAGRLHPGRRQWRRRHAGDAAAILEQSGADAVMIGRAHYGAPWTAGAIARAAAATIGQRRPPGATRRLRRCALRGHAGALRRRKRPAPSAQASRLVSRPPRAVSGRRDAQDDPDGDRAGRASSRAASALSPTSRPPMQAKPHERERRADRTLRDSIARRSSSTRSAGR